MYFLGRTNLITSYIRPPIRFVVPLVQYRIFMKNLRSIFFVLLFFGRAFSVVAAPDTLSVVTWNIQNLGKSKSDEEIAFMASVLRTFDMVAVQEVVAGVGGAPAVARLADALNRTGSKWDYNTSDPTLSTSGSSERYAFLWKTSRVQRIGRPSLEQTYRIEIEREPFMMDFRHKTDTFTLVSLHAIPKNKQPEKELKYLKYLPGIYPGKILLIMGDFNCPQSHSVFGPLKNVGYKPALTGQKTSLRRNCLSRDCLASEYDNIFYPTSKIRACRSGVVYFNERMTGTLLPDYISDHLPVYMYFNLR